MNWTISERALADLESIARWGAEAFGLQQAHKYQLQFHDALDLICRNPGIGRERNVGAELVRTFPCGSHQIVYRIEGDEIAVVRVLHQSQTWPRLIV
jgi:toxin ParE1/3/4